MTDIGIHLTAWAPGCADLPRRHPDLWPWLHNLSPEDVVLWLADRLDRPVNQIAFRAEGSETVVYARVEGEPTPVLMAVVHVGVTSADLASARSALISTIDKAA